MSSRAVCARMPGASVGAGPTDFVTAAHHCSVADMVAQESA